MVQDGVVDNITPKNLLRKLSISQIVYTQPKPMRRLLQTLDHLEKMLKTHLELLDPNMNTHLWVNLLK